MKKILLGVLLTSLSAPAFSEGGFSLDILLGTAEQTLEFEGFSIGDGDDTSIGLRGAYAFSDYLAFEIAHHNYGETDKTYIDGFGDTINERVETTASNLGIKGIAPINDAFSFHGRAGVSFWELKYRETDSFFPGQVLELDDDGNDIYYGVGMRFRLGDLISMGIDYTITKMDVTFVGVSLEHEVKDTSLSLGFHF